MTNNSVWGDQASLNRDNNRSTSISTCMQFMVLHKSGSSYINNWWLPYHWFFRVRFWEVNSLLHLTNECVDPFHADATYSTTNSWYDEKNSNRHVSTNIFHRTHFYVQPDSQSKDVVITQIARIASCLVVPVSQLDPIQISLGHPIASLLI